MRPSAAGALLAGALALVVSACSSTASNSAPRSTVQPTIRSTVEYANENWGLRFDYPANWHVGHRVRAGSTSIVPLRVPRSPASVRVTISRINKSFERPPVGRRIKTSAGTVSYRRVSIAGRAAVEVDVQTKPGLTQISTEVNGGSHGYTVSVVTPKPPLESRTIDGYRQMVRSLQID